MRQAGALQDREISAFDALAARAFWKSEVLDPTDRPCATWETLSDDERSFYRDLVGDLLMHPRLIIRSMFSMGVAPTTTEYEGMLKLAKSRI